MFAILPLVTSIFMLGMISLQNASNLNSQPPVTQNTANNSGQTFLNYRGEVLTYVINHPATLGTVATGLLSLSPQTLPAGITNNVVATASGNGRIIYTWATLPAGTANYLVKSQSGDASIGTTNGTVWTSPVYGIQAAVVPGFVPTGSVLSIQQIGY